MQDVLFFIKKYGKDIVLIFLVIISLFISSYALYINYIKQENSNIDSLAINNDVEINDENEDKINMVYVDVKGAVKKPGVYNVNADTIINDVIKLAGGFKSNAYLNNINLSKKVTSEMVIYVYTKTEYTKNNEIITSNKEETICKTPDYNLDNCIDNKGSVIENGNANISNTKDENNETNKKLINLNTADIKELTSITGIGEAKAEAIIDYRNKNGSFKVIEDIKNVSGIGDSLFEKIKDFITI